MGSPWSLWPLTLKALVLHCVKSSWDFATAPCCAPCLSTWGESRDFLCRYLGWVTTLYVLGVYMNLTSKLCTCSCDVMMCHVVLFICFTRHLVDAVLLCICICLFCVSSSAGSAYYGWVAQCQHWSDSLKGVILVDRFLLARTCCKWAYVVMFFLFYFQCSFSWQKSCSSVSPRAQVKTNTTYMGGSVDSTKIHQTDFYIEGSLDAECALWNVKLWNLQKSQGISWADLNDQCFSFVCVSFL